MNKLYFFFIGLAVVISFIGCSSSDTDDDIIDDVNSIAGSYEIIGFQLENCFNPDNEHLGVYSDGQSCVIDTDYLDTEYCRSGRLIINDDNTFTSTARLVVSGTTNIFPFSGSGQVVVDDEIMNVCLDGGACYEFARMADNSIEYSYVAIACSRVSIRLSAD